MNLRSPFFLLLIITLQTVLQLSAEEPGAYTLEECIAIGMENSAAALRARSDRAMGDALVDKARSEAMPQISLNASYTRIDELQEIDLGDASGSGGQGDGSATAFTVGSLDNYQASAEVNQLLYSGGRVRAALRAARSTREYYDWSAADTEDALLRDIRLGFHAVLYAGDALDVAAGSVSNLTIHVQQAEAKHRSGAISEFDLLSANVRLANEVTALIAARNAFDLAAANLKRLLALEEPALRVEGDWAFTPLQCGLEELTELALDRRPAVQRLEMLVRLRMSDASAAGSGRWPSLRAIFNYTESNPYGFAAEGGDWEGHWTAGLTGEWTLWDGGLTRASVREKRLEVEKARIDLEDMRRTVRLQVESAFLAMHHAAQAVEAGGGNVQMATKALEIAGTRFESGLGTHLEFADSALSLSAARLGRVQSLRAYHDAVARLQYACGLEERDLYREMKTRE